MKVVALVSGGKDSCYAMQRCIDYGHEIIALANLLPMDDAVDELDSFMFQTVGHQMVGAIAQCMGLPLFRRRIQGTARLQQLRYKRTTGDEVEDLEKLLLAVTKKYPDVGGVSSGAIASDYQRLRVECICSRLGLVSFAYLWKQDQALLLQNMIDSGLYAILVKVAAIGMDPYKHLGKDLLYLQPHLTHLSSFKRNQDYHVSDGGGEGVGPCLGSHMLRFIYPTSAASAIVPAGLLSTSLYGSNVCGEGGEYESLTLDSPLFKHVRIVLDEYEVALHSPDQIAPVGVLHPTKFHLEVKSSGMKANLESFLTPVFEVTGDFNTEEETVMDGGESPVKELPDGRLSEEVQSLVISQQHGLFTLGCWREPNGKKLDVREELRILLLKIEVLLQSKGLTWGNVVYVRLFLEDMVNFGAANEVYMNHITEEKCEQGVPSRCCMQVCLTKGNMGQALLEVAVAADLTKRVLHVQSISCWAPSCIGPYSQATLQGDILHMAGQLGLDPPTMTLLKGGAVVEMQQALDNCEEVAGAFRASLQKDALAITVYCSASLNPEDQVPVEECLLKFLAKRDRNDDGDGDTGALCRSTNTGGVPEPLIFYVLVPALPKGAKVEVEPSLFVDYCDDYQSPSPSWQRVHLDPPANTEILDVGKMSNNLTCFPCEGLILQKRYCRALVFIGTSSGLIHLGGGDGGAQVNQGLERALREAVDMLSLVLERTSLCWLEVTTFRIYFDVEAITTVTLREAVTKVIEKAPAGGLTPMLIPVNGAGRTIKSQKPIVIDFMARGARSLS